jgi:ribosomal protein S18 acetylase RimI-like enzyme
MLMVIRPLAVGELETFSRVAGRTEHAASVQDYIERLLTRGYAHHEWFLVLEEANQIIGTIAYWTLPSLGKPTDFVLLELPWEREDSLTLGAQFVQHAVLNMQALGASEKISHVIDLPPVRPQWQYFPEQRAALLTHCGFVMQRETLRWECQVGESVRAATTRLTFRPLEDVGVGAFIEAIERGSEGTLDRLIRQECEQAGPAQHAKEMFEDIQRLGYVPGWWQLAYNQTGELVGFVMPSANQTVGYIGVLPEHRGRGYSDDLLARLTATFSAAGVSSCLADTDVSNTTMANAFRRAGWRQFGRRQEYALDLTARLAAREAPQA